MSIQKVSVVAGLHCRKLWRQSQRYMMDFIWLERHKYLIGDQLQLPTCSATTFCPIVSDCRPIIMTVDTYNFLRVHISGDRGRLEMKTVETLSIESTVLNMHDVIHIIRDLISKRQPPLLIYELGKLGREWAVRIWTIISHSLGFPSQVLSLNSSHLYRPTQHTSNVPHPTLATSMVLTFDLKVAFKILLIRSFSTEQ